MDSYHDRSGLATTAMGAQSDLRKLLHKACDAPDEVRRRRRSNGQSVSNLIDQCSQTQPHSYVAWSFPDNFDLNWESLRKNSFVSWLFDSSLVSPQTKVAVKHLKEDEQFICSIRISKPSNLQDMPMEAMGWIYVPAEVYAALSSKGICKVLPIVLY
jgi:hypothetical protein